MNYGKLIDWGRLSGGITIKYYEVDHPRSARYLVTVQHPFSVLPVQHRTNHIADAYEWAYRTANEVRGMGAAA